MEELIKLIQTIWTKIKICMRPCAVELVNADGIISTGPVLMHAACISGDGANADCDIYNGTNANATRKNHLEALSGTTFNWEPPCGSIYDLGLYVKVNASTTFVMATYKPLTEDEVKVLRG
jgi:hypothetical protein